MSPIHAMTLDELLAFHRGCANSSSLPESFGDGYLYAHSFLFRNVRDTALRLGCTYEMADLSWYFGWKYAALPRIIETRKIPYIDNSGCVYDVLSRCPRHFRAAEIPKLGLLPNYTLHESAHVIASHVTAPLVASASARNQVRKRAFLAAQLAEAFAVTVDALLLLLPGPEAMKYFAWLNSYNTGFRRWSPEAEIAARLLNQRGFRFAFRFFLFGSLWGNFLYSSLPKRDFERLLALCGSETIPRQEQKQLQILARSMVSPADLGFRATVAELYFNLVGLGGDIGRLSAFDPFAYFERNSDAIAVAGSLGNIVENGVAPAASTSEALPPSGKVVPGGGTLGGTSNISLEKGAA